MIYTNIIPSMLCEKTRINSYRGGRFHIHSCKCNSITENFPASWNSTSSFKWSQLVVPKNYNRWQPHRIACNIELYLLFGQNCSKIEIKTHLLLCQQTRFDIKLIIEISSADSAVNLSLNFWPKWTKIRSWNNCNAETFSYFNQ